VVVGLIVDDANHSTFVRRVIPVFRRPGTNELRYVVPPLARAETPFRPTGLAFSGGGIRSASFCLGVLMQFTSVPLVFS
jgi:hypothetical protein